MAAIRKKIGPTERELNAKREKADTLYRTIKADFDSKSSFFVIETEHYGKAVGSERDRLQRSLDEHKKELDELGSQNNEDARRTAEAVQEASAGLQKLINEVAAFLPNPKPVPK